MRSSQNLWEADCFLLEADKCGLELGKDYKLTVSHTDATVLEYSSRDITIYIQQPGLVGKTAWKVINKLWDKELKEKEFLVPYKRRF